MWVFTIEAIVNNSIFFYALLLILICLGYVLISSIELGRYMRRNNYASYRELLISRHAPCVSVISPVANIQDDVVDHVRALLALQYNNFDIIVVNDGSTDNTLQNLRDFYQLEAVDFVSYEQIKTQPVQAYYKSRNLAFSKLTVIDKARGGEPDSLNAGLNASQSDLVLCIETHCVLDKNSLLKLVKPFLEEKTRVIAVGAAVHVANSGGRHKGHLLSTSFPKKLLPAFQAIEYFKSYLLERLTWSRLNGIHPISGAVGLFDKEILTECGGYSTKTSKEGFELMVRMSKYMHDNNLKYRTVYIPDPLCWIQAPARFSALSKQKNAWARGNFQTFWLHRDLFFNRKYGSLGLINFPFLFFLEGIIPLMKLLGVLVISGLVFTGQVNREYLGLLLAMIYLFAVFLSAVSVLFEERSYRPYSSLRDISKILVLIFIAPLIYHPLTVYWKIAALVRLRQ